MCTLIWVHAVLVNKLVIIKTSMEKTRKTLIRLKVTSVWTWNMITRIVTAWLHWLLSREPGSNHDNQVVLVQAVPLPSLVGFDFCLNCRWTNLTIVYNKSRNIDQHLQVQAGLSFCCCPYSCSMFCHAQSSLYRWELRAGFIELRCWI